MRKDETLIEGIRTHIQTFRYRYSVNGVNEITVKSVNYGLIYRLVKRI